MLQSFNDPMAQSPDDSISQFSCLRQQELTFQPIQLRFVGLFSFTCLLYLVPQSLLVARFRSVLVPDTLQTIQRETSLVLLLPSEPYGQLSPAVSVQSLLPRVLPRLTLLPVALFQTRPNAAV